MGGWALSVYSHLKSACLSVWVSFCVSFCVYPGGTICCTNIMYHGGHEREHEGSQHSTVR